jgi:hypothetical protein
MQAMRLGDPLASKRSLSFKTNTVKPEISTPCLRFRSNMSR